MANDEEYEIMPHRTIKKIKKEIEVLQKKSKSKQEINSPSFKKSIDNLTESMNSLMDIFKEASEEMKIEGKTEENVQTQIGPLVENHRLFPERVNAHFVKVESEKAFSMRTWERGSGITLACGTGACACCVAGVLHKLTGRSVTAHLPGGDMDVEFLAQKPEETVGGSEQFDLLVNRI